MALDYMKAHDSSLEQDPDSLGVVLASIEEAQKTVERVRESTTQPGFWPRLQDKSGTKLFMELQLLRRALVEHQILRLGLYAGIVAASTDKRAQERLAEESVEATKRYEGVLVRMGGAMVDLGRHYGLSLKKIPR